MNPKPVLQSLPLECQLEILKYVPIPECIILRSSCASLKYAVDEHFRTGVRTLPVLLTTSEKAASQYLWCKNYLTVPGFYKKFLKFVEFIGKHMPRITKLSMVIDSYENFVIPHIPMILKIYSNQLKVLTLKSTSYYEISLRGMFPSLEEFSFHQAVFSTYQPVEELKSFPSLKRIHCTAATNLWRYKSETVEFIEIDELFLSDVFAFMNLQEWFKNLKKVIVQKPFIELNGSDFSPSYERILKLVGRMFIDNQLLINYYQSY